MYKNVLMNHQGKSSSLVLIISILSSLCAEKDHGARELLNTGNCKFPTDLVRWEERLKIRLFSHFLPSFKAQLQAVQFPHFVPWPRGHAGASCQPQIQQVRLSPRPLQGLWLEGKHCAGRGGARLQPTSPAGGCQQLQTSQVLPRTVVTSPPVQYFADYFEK